MSSSRTIIVVDEFHPSPKGRYKDDAPGCDKTSGEVFRNSILIKALESHDKVIVDLTGYNRYGRSFLDEAFGGLISRAGLTKALLDEKLVIKHDTVPSFVATANERILAADLKRQKN